MAERRLIAGGLISEGLSRYWWEGKIVEKVYFNISAFTVGPRRAEIIAQVEKLHSDKTPIIAFFKIEGANRKFLDWVAENVA